MISKHSSVVYCVLHQVGAEQAEHVLDVSQLAVWRCRGGVGGWKGKWGVCCSPHLSVAQWAGAWFLVTVLGWGSWGQEGLWSGVRWFVAALVGLSYRGMKMVRSLWGWSGWSGWQSGGAAGRPAPCVGMDGLH